MFQLNKAELEDWRSQIVTSNPAAKMALRRPPYAFTEQGVAMLSAVLHSKRAVQTSITIVCVFIKLCQLLATHKDLAHKMEELERAQKEQASHIATMYEMLEQLMAPSEVPPSRRIGFYTDDK